MAEDQYQAESVFNMALAYLKRIDKLLYLCQQSAMSGDVDNWTKNLRGVYREASIRLTEEEEVDVEGNIEDKIDIAKLTDPIIEKSEANFRNIYFLLNNASLKLRHKRTLMFLLDTLEIKIRKIMQKKNMLLPSKNDPTKAVLNM